MDKKINGFEYSWISFDESGSLNDWITKQLMLNLIDQRAEMDLTTIYGNGPINSIVTWDDGPWSPYA